MGVCKYRIKEEGSPCRYYIKGGLCFLPDQYRCIESILVRGLGLSYSQVNDFTSCKRKYYYRNIKGIIARPEMVSKPMKIGQLFHTGYGDLFRKTNLITRTINKYWPGEILDEDKKEINKVLALLDYIHGNINPQFEGLIGCEQRFRTENPDIVGVFDRLYEDHFVEIKLTSRPEFFISPHFLESQIASYFLANPNLQYCTMEVVRAPRLRTSGQYEDEASSAYQFRTSKDIKKRPAYYFQGYDKETKTFGRKFFRNEFNLEEIQNRYKHIEYEIRSAIERDAFYKEQHSCLLPSQCEYLGICESGGVSDLLFNYRKKPRI